MLEHMAVPVYIAPKSLLLEQMISWKLHQHGHCTWESLLLSLFQLLECILFSVRTLKIYLFLSESSSESV